MKRKKTKDKQICIQTNFHFELNFSSENIRFWDNMQIIYNVYVYKEARDEEHWREESTDWCKIKLFKKDVAKIRENCIGWNNKIESFIFM